MGTSFEDILNFLIPIFVYLFLGWIIYKIPPVQEGVHKLMGWIRNKREEREEIYPGATSIKTIEYE